MIDCPYMEIITDVETGSEDVCGLWWKLTGQDEKPYFERDRLYCIDPENCKLRIEAEFKHDS